VGDWSGCRGAELADDLERLGQAFTSLYLTALNGVVCDPNEACGPCKDNWEQGKAVVDRYDSKWSIHKAFSLAAFRASGEAGPDQ
jgi:hypothetical protein